MAMLGRAATWPFRESLSRLIEEELGLCKKNQRNALQGQNSHKPGLAINDSLQDSMRLWREEPTNIFDRLLYSKAVGPPCKHCSDCTVVCYLLFINASPHLM